MGIHGMTLDFSRWLTISQAARILDLSEKGARFHVKNGTLEIMQTPLGVLISEKSVQRLVLERQLYRANKTLTALRPLRTRPTVTSPIPIED